MSTDPSTRGNTPTGSGPRRFVPLVPENTTLREMTLRAVILGLVMTVILGAANAYLGLRAGMTIAATYPAAIIGMAVLRLFKGSILEENIARTVGSIGESIAAGAVFTLPAFVIAHCWTSFSGPMAWAKSSALMIVGGFLGRGRHLVGRSVNIRRVDAQGFRGAGRFRRAGGQIRKKNTRAQCAQRKNCQFHRRSFQKAPSP